MSAWWLILVALVVIPGPDPKSESEVSTLIEGLKAPRRAARDRAATRLMEIGDAARPGLLKAIETRDLELKARAAIVLDSIEGRELGRPRLIVLDFRDKPLSQIVDAIAERSGEGLVLQTANDLKRGEQPTTLIADEKVSFWEAVERLSKVANLRVSRNVNDGWNNRNMMGGFNRLPRAGRVLTGKEIVLTPSGPGPAPPTSRSGRFNIAVATINHQRDRTLGAADGRRPLEFVVDRFEVQLRLDHEPSLEIGKVGEIEGLEARDDRDQSLVPVSPLTDTAQNESMIMHNYRNQPGQVSSALIQLHYPEHPGTVIRVLKGAFTVNLVGTRSDAVVASLVSGLNVPVRRDGVSLTVHEVKPMGIPTVRSVEFTLTRPGTVDPTHTNNPFFRTVNVAPPTGQGWLQFVDARGRQVDRVAVPAYMLNPSRRSTIQFNQPNGSDLAVEVRYLPPNWTTLTVPFEFHDLPMP